MILGILLHPQVQLPQKIFWRRQDSYEAAQQVTMNRLNFMQTNLTSFRKAMQELLAIMKKTTAERRVSFGQEIELISQLATTKGNSPIESTVGDDVIKSPTKGLINMAS